MFHRSLPSVALLAGGCLLGFSATTHANVVANVGSGPATVQVYFNWPDAFNARYVTSYGVNPTDSIDGYDATQIAVNADPGLTVTWTNYGSPSSPDYFMDDATYTGGHTSVGSYYSDATPENYWHEWINYGNGWVFGDGASNDILTSGDSIGWVFGSDNTPVPEPAGLAAIAAVSTLLGRRRR